MRKFIQIIVSLLLVLSIVGCTDTNVSTLPTIEHSILANRTQWRNSEELYEVETHAFDSVQGSSLYRFQEDLLSTYYVYNSELKKSIYHVDRISITSGEVVSSIQIKDMMTPEVQVLEEHIVIKDLNDNSAYVYDDTFTLVEEYTFDSIYFVFNTTAERAYVFTEGNGIEVIDLVNDTESIVFEHARDITLTEVNDTYVAFTYVDIDTLRRTGAVLDINLGDIEAFPLDYSPKNMEYGNGTWVAELYTDTTYVVGKSEELGVVDTEKLETISLMSGSGHILHKAFNKEWQNILTVYDSTGKYIDCVELVGTVNTLMQDMVWYEEYNGYFMTLMSDEDGMDRLLFWELAEESSEELEMQSIDTLGHVEVGHSVSEELYKRAEEIGDMYGVDILIAEQCDTVFTDHTAELLVEEEDIEIALETIKATLETFPEGFFDQLKHDTYSTIELQLTGMLAKNTSTEDITYISQAFVYSEEDKLVMVVDSRGTHSSINQVLQQTMYHEFSHMIDKRLSFRSRYVSDAVYSEEVWNSLNPNSFEYYGHYYGVLLPEYREYFIDPYACSNADEDRARILEYAAMGKLDGFKDMDGIMAKYAYYCESIRDGFYSSEWEEVVWESIND
ncbi:MAG: hypothetical protein E7191_02350 [Erysipelotrichaceae bacterium]|nr:hypothetical protein [Erysipelotrichaceae bacterium]